MTTSPSYQIKLNHFKDQKLKNLFDLENDFSIKLASSLGTPRSLVLFKKDDPIAYLDFNYYSKITLLEAKKNHNLNLLHPQSLLWLDSLYTAPPHRQNHYGFYLLLRLREYYNFPAMGLLISPLEKQIKLARLKKAYMKVGFTLQESNLSSKSKIMFSPANYFKPEEIKSIKTKIKL